MIGVAIGKEVFHLVGLGADGNRLSAENQAAEPQKAFGRMPPYIIGMKACLSVHFASRMPCALGHEPEVSIRQALRERRKNDYDDAEDIAAAEPCSPGEEPRPTRLAGALPGVTIGLPSDGDDQPIPSLLIEQRIAVKSSLRALRKSLFATLENRFGRKKLDNLACGDLFNTIYSLRSSRRITPIHWISRSIH